MLFKEVVKNTLKRNKVLVKNFSSLTLLQISQYILPLITFPYLVRVLGPDGYGLVAFATAFVGYFTVLIDYGFNLSATKEISVNRNDKVKVSEIYSSVIIVKLILFVISIFIVIPIICGFTKFQKDSEVYLISFLSVFGTTMFPVWFFQGMERMSFISFINIVIKILWVFSIFIFIHSYNDIITLVTLNAISSFLIAIIGMISVSIYFKVRFKVPSFNQIKNEFVEGWHYFISQASISLYTISNIFILGLFANDSIVGYFSAADKVRNAIQNLSGVAGRTIFPHLSSEFKRSKEAAIVFLRKYILVVGSVTLLSCVLLFIFTEDIISIILGNNYYNSVILLKIISFLPIIIFLSNVSGIQIMVNLGYKKEFSKIILFAGIFNIFLSFIIVPYYLSLGTAFIVVITELIVTIQMIRFLKKKDINVFKFS